MLRAACIAVLLLALSGCTQGRADSGGVDPQDTARPKLGACRALVPDDIAQASNATAPVACTARHTARPTRSGPARGPSRGVPTTAALGATSTTAAAQVQRLHRRGREPGMRTMLSWAWFRPAKDAWDAGAHWFRCDVVGGGDQIRSVHRPAQDHQGPAARPARRPVDGVRPGGKRQRLGQGPVHGEARLAGRHHHRARQTDRPLPGRPRRQVRTRDFCSKSVGAWLDYPVDYDFGYTWFHAAEWEAGNRRSVCWARTDHEAPAAAGCPGAVAAARACSGLLRRPTSVHRREPSAAGSRSPPPPRPSRSRRTAPEPPHARACYRLAYDAGARADQRVRSPVRAPAPTPRMTFFVGHARHRRRRARGRRRLRARAAAASTTCPRSSPRSSAARPTTARLSLLDGLVQPRPSSSPTPAPTGSAAT